ncbi:MAG: DEAD-box ATP-dependent helicase CshA [Verrucomicrobiota bacterium]|jgi:ATP-dependent RNA helicase DeaD
MQSAPFCDLGLSPELLKAVEQMGFQQSSPIQAATIPILLSGKDVAGLSRTGSGKTAAFAIPAIQKVDPKLRAPQVLILCPTRELAVQIAGEVAKLSAFTRGIRELAIYGGQSYGVQYRGLEEGAQIIAGTPGRVMDHLDRGSLKLDHLRMVVLDEADRMLDMGFRDDIATILQQAPENRQTAFFSATMPPAVEQLIRSYTNEPQWVRLETRAESAPNIEQCYYEVSHGSRAGALCRVLEATNLRFGIVFCSTKSAVDGVTEHLIAEGYQADRLHGDMSQAMRERVMRRFRDGKLEFLVATDVAARGIDVDDIEAVINYDIPRDPEDYVHRIGRTGRAGRSGRAITFVTSREVYALDRIQRLTRVKIRRERMPTPGEAAHRKAEELVKIATALIEKKTHFSNVDLAKGLLSVTTPEAAVESLLYLLTNRKAAIAKARGITSPSSSSEESSDAVDTVQSAPSRQPRPEYVPRGQGRGGAPRSDRPSYARERPARPPYRKERPRYEGGREETGSARSSSDGAPWVPKAAARVHPKTGAPRAPHRGERQRPSEGQ